MQQRNQRKLGLWDSGPELNIKMKKISKQQFHDLKNVLTWTQNREGINYAPSPVVILSKRPFRRTWDYYEVYYMFTRCICENHYLQWLLVQIFSWNQSISEIADMGVLGYRPSCWMMHEEWCLMRNDALCGWLCTIANETWWSMMQDVWWWMMHEDE